MPSALRWTYKGEKQEHHGEQRIELGDLVIGDEHGMGTVTPGVSRRQTCANTATEWC
jgi:hypothetical protein